MAENHENSEERLWYKREELNKKEIGRSKSNAETLKSIITSSEIIKYSVSVKQV